MRFLGFALILFAFWVLNSGHYTPLLLSFGVGSCALVLYLSRKMDIIDDEGAPLQLGWRFVPYFFWLLWQIVLANIDVAKRVLSPSMPISPTMIELKTSQRTDIARVVYANSITLTPGTVTVGLNGDNLIVHAIAKEVADDLAGGEMDRRVTALEVRD